jgi:hypothetical protein
MFFMNEITVTKDDFEYWKEAERGYIREMTHVVIQVSHERDAARTEVTHLRDGYEHVKKLLMIIRDDQAAQNHPYGVTAMNSLCSFIDFVLQTTGDKAREFLDSLTFEE